jgi:hypothetical protein
MVLSTETRIQKLGGLREPEKDQVVQKLFYRGANRTLKVSTIDLDYLIYNRHNGRLEAEMLTWEQENVVSPDAYDDDLHDKIDQLLWDSAPQKNKQTLSDLSDKGQQRPGIVSLDGVIIDGNRRAMILRRIEKKTGKKQYFDAIILPDSYADNQKEIVRLETQYQLGEDAKVDYGPLQKYLHVRRLVDLDIPVDQIDKLMNESPGNAQRLLDIMSLMDDYLEHIGCPRLYTMLKDSDGTKEGMFVDLHNDLKRITGGRSKIPWAFDAELDPMQLRLIQFDYIRLGDFADAKKVYREISHQGQGKNFFATKEIWEAFRDGHQNSVDPVTTEMGSLQDFMHDNADQFESKADAAKARDLKWSERVRDKMKENFGQSHYKLNLATEVLKPNEYLRRAKDYLDKIDLESPGLLRENENLELAMEINRLTFAIKKKFEKRAPAEARGA